MKAPSRFVSIACLALALWGVRTVARADEPAVEDAPSIVVERVRDPAMVPYRKGYELTRRVHDVAGGSVQLLFRVRSAKTKQPVAGLQIAIEGSKSYGTLEISPEGFFSIPLDDAALGDNAEFVTNQKKGSLELGITLKPQLPSEGLRYAMIVDAVAAARRAIREILPWYIRLFVGSVNGVGICYAEPGAGVEISGAGAARRPAEQSETDELDRKVHCADFTDHEKGLAAETVLVPTAGWQAIFLGS